MRVTTKNLMNNYLTNLNRNLTEMQKYQNQMSSGKEILKPSDNPFGTIRAMDLDTSIKQNDQYLKNIEDSIGWTGMTESALGNLTDSLQRTRELTVYGSNGSLSDTDMKAIAEEIKQIISQVAEVGNTNYDGRYIFAGQSTSKPPFEVVDDVIQTATDISGSLSREVSESVTMDINVSGTRLMDGSSEDLSVTLKNIYDRLMSGDNTALSNDSLGKLDEQMDNILSLRAEVGAKYNRLEASKIKNETQNLNLTELYAKTIDIDIAEKVMQYSMMESVYQASLATGGKILQPTLLNYL
ncbi:MAG: flagellar hook-associated protein FlgL [Clostridiales bacterium]|nr:flagellar hook-associated protein FlgL [Clostridiales bacterium]